MMNYRETMGSSNEQISLRERAELAVLLKVKEDNPAEFGHLERIVDLFKRGDLGEKIQINIVGLTKGGKTSIARGCLPYFKGGRRMLYHDHSDSVKIARKKEVVTSPPGEVIPSDQYFGIAYVDTVLLDLFWAYPGEALLWREANCISQNFDENGNPFGIPRGDIEADKVNVANGRDIRTIFTVAPENSRREKVALWEAVYTLASDEHVTLNGLSQMLFEAGIIDDADSPDKIKEAHSYSNNKISSEHIKGLVFVVYTLFIEGVANERILRELEEQEKYRDLIHKLRQLPKSLKEKDAETKNWDIQQLINSAIEQPDIVTDILLPLAYTRLKEIIYPDSDRRRDSVLDFVVNPVPENVLRSDSADVLKKYSLVNFFTNIALNYKKTLEARRNGESIKVEHETYVRRVYETMKLLGVIDAD